MTTAQAFEELISRRAWYKDLGIEKNTAGAIAKRFRDGEKISLDKIEEILTKAGYRVESEKQWSNVISDIKHLSDMPEGYFGCQEWMDLHAHMFPAGMPFIERIQAMDIYLKKKAALIAGPKSIVEKLLEEKEVSNG